MRSGYSWVIAIIIISTGCARRQAAPGPVTTTPKSSPVIVTATESRAGRVTSVNPSARYVVISYPVGTPLPAMDTRLHVYRDGLKVAEVKASKEQIDINAVADIVAGECRIGDEVRQQ
jgi:hypothetical protein